MFLANLHYQRPEYRDWKTGYHVGDTGNRPCFSVWEVESLLEELGQVWVKSVYAAVAEAIHHKENPKFGG